ncbi:hypothetical protein [Actinoplanes utahensis]|uniref:Uncharacterized protein n=1 Tax=Actinoplanes utahensis TaxID=1869 RepID=A0A0A6UNB7_ACTUT|nr:hypothetical protein [Actinoplanes utahensis]KHD76578.1 hypothetical protein MB27_16400 [Actinoplanes utahensis]GIF31270.1 hypothetical protein Aut01nite_42560 [Actinoplanes utahensis]
MIERLTDRWRRETTAEAAAVAAGTLAPGEAYAAHWWPEDFVARVEAVLARYEQDIARMDPHNDAEVWAAVERVVEGLNEADTGEIETTTREELCEYIDGALTDAGVDVEALTGRRGLDAAELTDQWRDW